MKSILGLLLLVWSASSFAADGGSVPVETPPVPKVFQNGQDYFVDFGNGRVAGFFQEIGKVVRAHISLRQIENTCDVEQILANCKFDMDVAARYHSVRWVQHPDPKKINEVVEIEKTSQFLFFGKIESANDLLTWLDAKRDGIYPGVMAPFRMSCDRMDWAKDLASTKEGFIIHSWSQEIMIRNTETDANENQTLSTVFDVVLKKLNDQTFEFSDFGRGSGIYGETNPFISSQVTTISFLNTSNQSCLVSFEASATEGFKGIRGEDFRKYDPATRIPTRSTSVLRSNFIIEMIGSVIKNKQAVK